MVYTIAYRNFLWSAVDKLAIQHGGEHSNPRKEQNVLRLA